MKFIYSFIYFYNYGTFTKVNLGDAACSLGGFPAIAISAVTRLGAVRFSTQIVHLGVLLFQTDFSRFVIYLQFVFHRIQLSNFVTFIQ